MNSPANSEFLIQDSCTLMSPKSAGPPALALVLDASDASPPSLSEPHAARAKTDTASTAVRRSAWRLPPRNDRVIWVLLSRARRDLPPRSRNTGPRRTERRSATLRVFAAEVSTALKRSFQRRSQYAVRSAFASQAANGVNDASYDAPSTEVGQVARSR